MAHLIDKSALVAEIEKLKECNRKICAGDFNFLKETYPEHYYSTEIYNDILSFLETLEVKEVDLEKEIKKYIEDNICGYCVPGVEETAKYFFELGLKVSYIDTLEVKESDETAKAFARIIRANLTGIDKDVQYKFEQLYKEITGEKMYQGYND